MTNLAIASPRRSSGFHVERVRLNQSGEDRFGRYWGAGAPLYRVTHDASNLDFHLRAASSSAARIALQSPDALYRERRITTAQRTELRRLTVHWLRVEYRLSKDERNHGRRFDLEARIKQRVGRTWEESSYSFGPSALGGASFEMFFRFPDAKQADEAYRALEIEGIQRRIIRPEGLYARANPLTNDELNVAVALGGAAVVGIVGGLAWYLATRPKKPASASNGGAAAARAVTPAGATWKQLSPTDTAGGGHTYLMSIAPIPDHTFASLQGELTGSSMTLLGVWDQGTVPPGWPSNDGDPNRWRIEFHVADEVHPQAVADLVGDLPSPTLFQLQS